MAEFVKCWLLDSKKKGLLQGYWFSPKNTYPLIQQQVISIDFGDFSYGCTSHGDDNITDLQRKTVKFFCKSVILSVCEFEESVSSYISYFHNHSIGGIQLWNDPLRLHSLDCQDQSAPRGVRV